MTVPADTQSVVVFDQCPSSEKATGDGFDVWTTTAGLEIIHSSAIAESIDSNAIVNNVGSVDRGVTTFVSCASVRP